MRNRCKSNWLILLVVIASLALACRIPFNLRGTPDQVDSEPIHPSDPDLDLTEFDLDEQDMVSMIADLPGTTIPLEMGASVFIPEGALPPDTAIDARVSEIAPMLPEGLDPIGGGLVITSDVEPDSPVMLRLPIPPEVVDPDRVVIVRLESNGKVTVLMTEVDGDAFVAHTPGFSTFSLASLLDEYSINLIGINKLLPGQLATYSFLNVRENPVGAIWQLSGDGSILHKSDSGVTIQAGSQVGRLTLSVTFIDIHRGMRWYGVGYINVAQEIGFSVSVVTDTPIVYEGDQVHIKADVHGNYTAPIKYIWNFGDGGADGSATLDAGSTTLELPARSFSANHRPYVVSVKAIDSDGEESQSGILISVNELSTRLKLEGEQHLQWRSPEVREAYHASALGNNQTYRFEWVRKPGGKVVDYVSNVSGETLHSDMMTAIFTEPGDYQIEVVLYDVTDGLEQQVGKAVLPVFVEGGDPLDAHILNWPLEIEPNQPVPVTFRAGGGRLVVGGQRGGYTITVDWGDGTIRQEENVAIAHPAYEPTIFDFTHQWEEEGTYQVGFWVEDLTGAVAYSQANIVVQIPRNYSGEVLLVDIPEHQEKFQLRINYSQVELIVGAGTVSVNIAINYSSDYTITHPNRVELVCTGTMDVVFSGEGPIAESLSLVMERDHLYSKEGPKCDSIPAHYGNEWPEVTLVGHFYEDGGFEGKLEPGYMGTRYFGIFADLLE